jgi:hypothetical protein
VLPHDDAPELDWILFRQDDVISHAQALRFMSESRLRRHLANGRWQVAHHGIYAAHNGELTWEQRLWVGVLAGGRGKTQAPLAGLTSLAASGFRGFDEGTVHVYVPARFRTFSTPHYVRAHRTRNLPPIDLSSASPPRTTAERSAIDAARWARSDYRARAIIAAAFQQRLVRGDEMLAAIYRITRLERRDLIISTVHDAAGGSESISELDFLNLCRRAGLPEPSRQTVVTDAAGRRRYRDAHFEEWKLHVEIDGSQHMDVKSWWADMQRQNDMWTTGERVLRFPAWALRNEPQKVIAAVRAALINAGWRP